MIRQVPVIVRGLKWTVEYCDDQPPWITRVWLQECSAELFNVLNEGMLDDLLFSIPPPEAA